MNKLSFSLLTYLNTSLSRVTCYGSGRLRFASICFVKLSHVSFIGCGCNVAQSMDTFILQYSNFLNASTSCSGGSWSVTNSTDVAINNCTFSNNVARMGGSLYIVDVTNLNINMCQFTNNHVSGRFRKGGAVYINEANSNISRCTFTDNQVSGSFTEGGAVYIIKTNSTISNSTFINNQCNGFLSEGGAVSINEANSSIITCLFMNNQVFGSFAKGGAVYVDESNSSINGSQFTNNRGTGSFAEGGAMHISDTNSSITTSVFINNQGSFRKGGALYTEFSTAHATYIIPLLIIQCYFSGNRGDVYSENVMKLSILESIFTNNSNTVALYCYSRLYRTIGDSKIVVNQSTFIDNGVAIISSNIKHMNIHNSNFTNHAGTLGVIQFNGNRNTENHAVINKINATSLTIE